jgi:Ni/Co efflux regulator RcnB
MTFPNHPGTGHTNSPPPPPPVHSATTQTFTGPANNPNGPHTFTGHNNTGGNSQNGPNGQNNNNRNIPGFNNNGRFQPINPGFGHSLRPRDNGRHAYNPSLFPRIFQTARRFHIAPYVQPRGWFFRSWAYGDFLPQGWFDAPYYLDWGYYRLPMPPIGCEWVREGNDALLVDVWTGEILSIEPNMFW